jgi:hypothetical protein
LEQGVPNTIYLVIVTFMKIGLVKPTHYSGASMNFHRQYPHSLPDLGEIRYALITRSSAHHSLVS